MSAVVFDHVTKRFDDVVAVDSLSLEIFAKEFMVLLGPSGCGKSTALRMIAGLETVTEGELRLGHRVINDVEAKDRDISMVFQSYALYPHMTVRQNLEVPLKTRPYEVDEGPPRKLHKPERAERVEDAARMLGLHELLDRKPGALSGGQRQRVALGRAIVRRPEVFLMDEPLSNLDAKLRVQTRMELADLQARLAITTVYVTHDQVEAMTMGDRVGVLKDGVLQQCDTPKRLYKYPANMFVAGFIGSPAMNLVDTAIENDQVVLGGRALPVDERVQAWLRNGPGSGKVTVGVRPEGFRIGTDGVPAEVLTVEELGSEAYLRVEVEHRGETLPLIVRTGGDTSFARGDRLHLDVTGPVHVFDDLEQRIGELPPREG